MLVHRTPIPQGEFEAFQSAIRASGRDPAVFKAQMFEARCSANDSPMRRVHVVTQQAAAQYDASTGSAWTQSFARHLARGFFG
ncbi:MAG TPA: hypothetical protein VEA40_12800 [Ramlibacter sp.]|nr:hypothetical protein [Ramlibacter sp.]